MIRLTFRCWCDKKAQFDDANPSLRHPGRNDEMTRRRHDDGRKQYLGIRPQNSGDVMRSAFRCLIPILVAGCASRQMTPGPVSSQPSPPPQELILRGTSWEDPELAARGLGRMEVVVRVADRTAETVVQALVSITLIGKGTPAKQLLSNDKGVVEFDSIAVWQYQLLVRAIGYGSASAEVPVSPGCRTDVEAYIGRQAIGINPPPAEPSRVRITTCRTSK